MWGQSMAKSTQQPPHAEVRGKRVEGALQEMRWPVSTLQTRCQVAHLAESTNLRELRNGGAPATVHRQEMITASPQSHHHSPWLDDAGLGAGPVPRMSSIATAGTAGGEIKSSTKLRPGKWRGDTLGRRSDLERAIWGESQRLGKGGNHQL